MEKYLKPKQYYIDLYDRHTVEGCRHLIELYSKPVKNPPMLNGKKPPKKMVDTVSKMALEWSLMFEKGDRFIRKEETISKWMAEAEEKDRFYESAEPPEDIRCLKCRAIMSPTYKDLMSELNKPNRVLFMFDCPNDCLPRRAFYDNGEEWIIKPNPCLKCGHKLDSENKVTKAKFITHYKCVSCGFTKIEEIERTANKKEEPDPNFEADRAKFCLSNEEGEKWRQELVRLEQMKQLVDEWKERDKNKELYDKIAKLKRLTIIDLEKLLIPVLEKSGYIKFQLSNPEIGKDFVVPFNTQDGKSDRTDIASKYDLKRILNKILENTNWRLMSDGVLYRLGVLSGRMRGYENEEDLKKLIK